MVFYRELVKNRNTVFFIVLGLLILLILFSYQRALPQKAIFEKDRLLFAASVQAYNQGDYQSSLNYLLQTSTPFQQDWNYLYMLGSVNMQIGNFEEADMLFQRAEELAPVILMESEFLNKRGFVFIQLGNKTEALDYLNHSYEVANTDEERRQTEDLIIEAQAL